MKLSGMLLSCKHIDYRVLCLGIISLLVTLGHPRMAFAQGCDNNDSVYQGGEYCIAATTSASPNGPQMPVLTFDMDGSSCAAYSYTMELEFSQPGDGYGNGQSYGVYQSPYLAGNAKWIVDWFLNAGDALEYSEGGHGSLEVDILRPESSFAPASSVAVDSFSFFVEGQNPSTGSITAFLNTLSPPWWYGHTLTWETYIANPPQGNFQFWAGWDTTGTYFESPVFGGPDGFGLSQLDGSASANPTLVTDDSLWTWTTNLMYGVQVANRTQSAAYTHFSSQLKQMYIDTAGGAPQYPNAVGGYCNLTWNGTGNNAYGNADWINLYNGGYWATWAGPTAGWQYGNSYNPNYTVNVCNQPSYTI